MKGLHGLVMQNSHQWKLKMTYQIANGSEISRNEERTLQSMKTKTHFCFMSYRIKKVSHRLKGDDAHLETTEAVSNLLGAL